MDLTINRMKSLVSLLNKYRNAYYNEQKSIISDYQYDKLFDELEDIEDKTGIVLSNSPTVTVGYEVKGKLQKTIHSHPMLSLDKTKSIDDLIKFAKNEMCLLMCKMDGLTVLLTYEDGILVKAETRGNGIEGEDITHTAKVFKNIPLTIPYKGRIEIEGEAIITYDDFQNINSTLSEDDKYKNPRNLVSGSVRQLDSKIAANRNIKFIAWKVPTEIPDCRNLMTNRLCYIKTMGFEIVPYMNIVNKNNYEDTLKTYEDFIEDLRTLAVSLNYPIDGLVLTYEDISYGLSLGETSHHPKHSLAYKFYDEEVETELVDVEWTMGKTGTLTPTAVFKPVEIDGTTVERASLHNISVMCDLYPHSWHSGLIVTVYKANQIIPQISKVDFKRDCPCAKRLDPPHKCPICGAATEIQHEAHTKILVCTNPSCEGKLLSQLTHFASKDAMNIDGLSESTIKKFISYGWLNTFIDIYNLYNYITDMKDLEGFGEKSVNNLLSAIEKSKNTTLDRFIYSLSIPNVGKSASKTLSNYFNGDFDKFFETTLAHFDWTILPDFGGVLSHSINYYFLKNYLMVDKLAKIMNFQNITNNSESTILKNKTFCITGSLNIYGNRNELVSDIEKHGGKVTGSVSKKTDYLLTNDMTSGSSKNQKAKSLNIPIITEEEFINMIK